MIRIKIACMMKLINIQLTSLSGCHSLINDFNQDDECYEENMEAIMSTLSQMQIICKDVNSRCASLWLEVNKEKAALAGVEEKAPF